MNTNTIVELMASKGFKTECLGGNCEGYTLRIGAGTVTVTSTDDPTLPDSFPVYVGFDDGDDAGAEIPICSEDEFNALDFRAELSNLGVAV